MYRRHLSYWESEIPSVPHRLEFDRQVDVLIVGAGFMGRWLAYFLRQCRPAPKILIVERDRFTYGASSRNAGFLTCGQVSEMLTDAQQVGESQVIDTFLSRRAGLAIVRDEFPEFPVDLCGSTDYDEVTEPKRELALRLNEAAGDAIYSVHDACLGVTSAPAMFNSADAGIQPVRLLRAISESTSEVPIAFGTEATRIGEGTATVEVGDRCVDVAYEKAFICTNGFVGSIDAATQIIPGRGQIIVTSPVETTTDQTLGYLNGGYDYFRFVDGRLLLGGGRDRFSGEQGVSHLEGTSEVRDYLQTVASRIIGHEEWAIEHHWAGIMAFAGGGHLCGTPRKALDTRTEIVAGFGGMGVALTPVYAQELAAEM